MSVRSLVRLRPPLPAPVRTAVLALGAQAGLALAYLVTTDAGLAAPAIMAVPLIWLTAAAVAVRHVDPRPAGPGLRVLAGVVGATYGVGLAAVAGMVRPAASATGVEVILLPPWWGPAIQFGGPPLAGTLFPYRVAGYAALAYLVGVAVIDVVKRDGLAVRGAGGVLGTASCVGCALPLVAGLGASGVGAGLATALAGSPTYALGTVVFLLALGLLAYRPADDAA